MFLAGLILVLDPATGLEECPNYIGRGNGDTSAFRDSSWDLYLPVLAFVWIMATIVEQALPFARGSRTDSTVRATAAVSMSIIVSCCVLGPLIFMCRR
ncbi:hypothetical protein QLQ12_36335 [Actinoplanes sp. NEAU-A12]|uniref:Uncharacterized protein n=1 Tax=Actinoplanes sandaracinus TaxID=3045177 RepID=A0ABT6WWK3_9ACTN|nr:hypothetical protein [Actinoplanes sandaracinus]MDI6104074.1 hypothetical protein [Actinoplanes sandaracinus]